MEKKSLRRRGRPPFSQNVESASESAAQEPVVPSKRRRRASVGGLKLKLQAPERKGYVRRWFNDVQGRLAEAEELAYDFVCDPTIKSDGTDSRVRRLVGTQANGQPLYSYLMETPVSEYDAGIQEKEEIHRAVDKAINEGRDATGRVGNSYGEGSIQAG